MAMLQNPLVQILLWLVAGAALFWIFGPSVMYALGKSRYWMDVSDNPADAEPDGRDRKYESRFREWIALGFRPAGKIVEHARFKTPLHWNWKGAGVRYLAAADGKTFVGFFRIGGGGSLRTNVSSAFEQGGLIQTASPGVSTNLDAGGNYKYDAVGDAEPQELLEMHARRLQEFAQERRLTVKAATMRELAGEQEQFTRLVMPKMKQGAAAFLILGMFAPFLMMARRLPPGMLPVTICVLAAAYAAIRWAILPSRVPTVARMVLVFGGFMLLSNWWIMRASPDRAAPRLLDRINADVQHVDRAWAVGRLVRIGRFGCAPMLTRLSDPSTKEETRAIIHDALVKLNGSDLGEAPAAWQTWCAQVRQRR